MTEDMSIESYLSQGGKLTNPTNVPPRYRAELMKMMATFVDSELAGAAGFADVINAGPGIKERIAAAKIVLEKTDNADRVLRLLGEFGADTARYATSHPWTARLPRDAGPGTHRSEHDMRLSVLNYPLSGWTDAVVMNLCMGLAVGAQLAEMQKVSYQPLAEAIRKVAPVEARHVELAEEGLARLMEQGQSDAIAAALAYWRPRVAAIFGDVAGHRFEQLSAWGLRHQNNAALLQGWNDALNAALARLGVAA
ncbi:Phenylacetic acid catabolic protein [Sedimentitalea nanhaiensis]|uniref:1,2-phenylacetyl-CoA epoxidase, catalytic subunit n=1 Tax=Sedimentitalea nanhaiensis TaxID=999627 RepID=A0A1I7CV26_9RHOB|nr:Phenylacetic acid catabolic protein [Sedimentitalea nanhaiensis]SFU03337.1 1,2-phenylacetyl-CoA epoxidase, catalytic subunit [Sedimentitalea nanhaiensis]